MSFTTNELMAYAVSRRLRSEDLVFIGVGTAGRAYTLAVGIPLVASRLAQLDHAPDLDIYLGNLLSPDLAKMPTQLTQDAITRWPGAHAPADIGNKVDALVRGDFTVSFESAAQVDRWGNLNITAIGAAEAPDVRLVGTLAQAEHLAFVERPIIVVDLSSRTFVEEVDVISSFGHASTQGSRRQLGYSTGGPALVVTDLCTFDFTGQGLMRLNSLHPGVTVDQVLDQMSFEPVIPDQVPQTPKPNEEQIKLIRNEIDEGQALLRH
ncbi:CoA-transferase [Nesterenkonia ebinurensis]|uniref:CoA-transferase n=1 Tax=Nesterenkonia ebinurensis TaxID=2608252 RepID=UPI00123E043D|nr:CoA-transferase [Nesterenkonia ebinurensis]